jgi:hypothetical protein
MCAFLSFWQICCNDFLYIRLRVCPALGYSIARPRRDRVYRRQVASRRRADGSESSPPTLLRCAMLNIEVGRRRANRFYDPCRLCVRCTALTPCVRESLTWHHVQGPAGQQGTEPQGAEPQAMRPPPHSSSSSSSEREMTDALRACVQCGQAARGNKNGSCCRECVRRCVAPHCRPLGRATLRGSRLVLGMTLARAGGLPRARCD